MGRRHLFALALTVSLGACAGGPPPDIATPTPVLPDGFLYQPDSSTGAALDTLLPIDDAGFVDLADAALENAPNLAEALARIDAARAGARRAGANRLPNVSGDASVIGTRINPNQFGSNSTFTQSFDTEQLSYGANITASWDPDIFGQLRAQERAAVARIDSASASAAAVRIALMSDIAGNVIDWRVLAARTQALEEDVAAAQRLADLARVREEAGLSPGFDRVSADATASASRTRLAALQSDRVTIIGQLITLTGLNATRVMDALDQPAAALDLGPAPASLPSELLANRPDVIAAGADLAASDADLAAAARARFPKLTLSAVVGLLAFSPRNFFEEDSIIGTLTAGIAGPLLDFGRIGADIDAAAADKQIAFQAYRGAVFQALGDAEAAYGLIAAADAEATLAIEQRQMLDRAANIASDRYRAGLSSFVEVLDARRAADTSGEAAAAAVGRAERARILLWQALGGDTPATLDADMDAQNAPSE